MAKKDREERMPEIVFLGPGKHRVQFRQTVFQIMEKDDDGIPTLCRMMKNTDVVHIQDGEEFMTGYVQRIMLVPKEKRDSDDEA